MFSFTVMFTLFVLLLFLVTIISDEHIVSLGLLMSAHSADWQIVCYVCVY